MDLSLYSEELKIQLATQRKSHLFSYPSAVLQAGTAENQNAHSCASQHCHYATQKFLVYPQITSAVSKLQGLFEDLLAVPFKSQGVQHVPSLHWKCKRTKLFWTQTWTSPWTRGVRSRLPGDCECSTPLRHMLRARLSLRAAALKLEEMFNKTALQEHVHWNMSFSKMAEQPGSSDTELQLESRGSQDSEVVKLQTLNQVYLYFKNQLFTRVKQVGRLSPTPAGWAPAAIVCSAVAVTIHCGLFQLSEPTLKHFGIDFLDRRNWFCHIFQVSTSWKNTFILFVYTKEAKKEWLPRKLKFKNLQRITKAYTLFSLGGFRSYPVMKTHDILLL